MPELPEVETIVREMQAASLSGTKIEKICIFWKRSIADLDIHVFSKNLLQQEILNISRRGKFIVITLSSGKLLVHLRMTGKFLLDAHDVEQAPHERVRLYLSDGRVLRFEDQRKFGKWYFTNSEKLLDKIGLEPLSHKFTLLAFKELLKNRRGMIKPFLLNQHYVAGIGNIYADEALFLAKIHPARPLDTLKKKEISALHEAIISVLKSGVANIGTSLGSLRANYFSVSRRRGNNQYQLKVFRREGLACPHCQTIIQKTVIGGRGTHFCPKCQIKPLG